MNTGFNRDLCLGKLTVTVQGYYYYQILTGWVKKRFLLFLDGQKSSGYLQGEGVTLAPQPSDRL